MQSQWAGAGHAIIACAVMSPTCFLQKRNGGESHLSPSAALSFLTPPHAHIHQFQETLIHEAASVVKACLSWLAEIL